MRRKTRQKLTRPFRQKGKVPITAYLQEFKDGAKVQLVANSFSQQGMYHPRYHGKSGHVVGRQGNCYFVEILDGKMAKKLIVHPVHLRAL